MNHPIVIAGADRSGTSLAYAILASHPDVTMTRRANLWRWFDERYGDLRDPENLESCLDAFARYERLQVLRPDIDRLRVEAGEGETTYGRVFRLLFEHEAARRGTTRWGDKSLHTEHAAARVFEEWPDARIVHMIRDPRDRFASVVKRYEKERKGIGAITGRWLRSVRRGNENVARYGERYMLLRYETLAGEPESTTRHLCDFLGLPFEPVMLTLQGVDEQRERGGNSSYGTMTPGAISTRSIGRYSDVLNAREIAFIEWMVGGEMAEFDYDPSGVRPTGAEAIRFALADLPIGTVKMRAWMTAENRNDRRGRSVPERRLRSA